MDEAVIEVKNLKVDFPGRRGRIEALRGVSFSVGREKVGIVGESGSGKSMTARALLKLLPAQAGLSADVMRFKDVNLCTANEAMMRKLRGKNISMIMQDPKFSLNPVITVGAQIREALLSHAHEDRTRLKAGYICGLLRDVGIQDAERVECSYPHQLSGGMGQRVMIAMMLALNPDLLIADEPTSALDASVREHIISLIDEKVRERNLALIFISHDIDLVSSFCDRVLVFYRGVIVERIDAKDLWNSTHPYTRALLEAKPRLGDDRKRLPVVAAQPEWGEVSS